MQRDIYIEQNDTSLRVSVYIPIFTLLISGQYLILCYFNDMKKFNVCCVQIQELIAIATNLYVYCFLMAF